MKKYFTLLIVLTAMAMSAQAQVAINATNFPDANFRSYLLAQDYGQDAVLTDAEIADIKQINVSEKNIKDLTGIGHFTALEMLFCSTNELTSLDLSKNTALTTLMMQYNQIKSIDLSKNTALLMLFITGNPLTSLDTSKLVNLEQLLGGKQDLSILDLSHNTKIWNLNFLDATWTDWL